MVMVKVKKITNSMIMFVQSVTMVVRSYGMPLPQTIKCCGLKETKFYLKAVFAHPRIILFDNFPF